MDATAQETWAIFMEARKETERVQWFLFTPALARLGAPAPLEGHARFTKRRMARAGHRAKWETNERSTWEGLEKKIKSELDQYLSAGWTLLAPVLIPLEADDYAKVWGHGGGETSYKALRHVEAVTQRRGYRISS